MALSLGVRQGSKIRIGSDLLQVVRVINDGDIVLGVSVNEGPVRYVSEYEREEILPQVFVQLGKPHSLYPRDHRLAFEAPRSIRIERVR